jgi:CheY-like chemotaxis protein
MPKTLLLADDSVTIQKVVGISFANEDVVLLTVDNGDDAIARARDARPDVVLADVVMPGKNGYDVCQTIKSDPELSHIPVLLLTGTFEAFDEERAARAGADGHITKPFEAQALVDKVNALLTRPTAASAEEDAEAGGRTRVGIGVVRPARIPAPPPQPVSHTADTAYDFFDEEVTAPGASGEPEPVREDTTVLLREPTATPASAAGDDAFELEDAPGAAEPAAARPASESPAGAPAFGGDDLELASPEEAESLFDDFAPPRAPEHEEAPERGVFELPEPTGGLEASPESPAEADRGPEPPAPAGWTAPVEHSSPEPEGFSWDAPPEAPAEERSEVPDWFTPAPDPGAVTQLVESDAGDPLGVSAETPYAPASREVSFGAYAIEAGAEPAETAFGEAVLDPDGARDYDVSSSDLGPPPVVAPAPAAPAAAAPSALQALGPERRELHDALEKLAWEAFGPVAENLVREAVERIERIAWEVVPQLAEALVKEEIRKLKGE